MGRDPLEAEFEELMAQAKINCIRCHGEGALDFYLPSYDLAVEIKAAPTERMARQLERSGHRDVVVLVGFLAVRKFAMMLGWVSASPEILGPQSTPEQGGA